MHDRFLTYFDEVARQGSIRKAAGVLNMSSTSVNRKIISIEQKLGVRLFDRHADGVELTQAGAVVLEHCRNTIFNYKKILTQVEDIREVRSGHIHIATLDSVATSLLPDVIDQFSQSYPEITYTIQTALPDEVIQSVDNGKANVGISFCNDLLPGVRIHSEKSTPIGAIMRPDHPLAERDALEISDLEPYHLVRSFDGHARNSLVNEALAQTSSQPENQLFTNSLPLARALILRKHGIGFYSKIGFIDDIDKGSLRYITVLSPVLSELKMGILISSRVNQTPANHLFCRSLSKSLKGLRLDS